MLCTEKEISEIKLYGPQKSGTYLGIILCQHISTGDDGQRAGKDGDARASSDAAVMIRESVGSDGDDDGDERMGGTAGGATDEATGANDGARAGSGDQVRGGAQDSGGRSDGGTAGRADTQTNSEPDHDDESGRA